MTDELPVASYAEVAAKNADQSPEEAAAPPPPQIETDETASSVSLVDVDVPSVVTVPSDFAEQEVQTETQAARLDREAEQEEVAKENSSKDGSGAKGSSKGNNGLDNMVTRWFAGLGDGAARAVVVTNLVGVVGLSSFLGYKAWDLHDRGRLGWGHVGIGLGLAGIVGVLEGVMGGYLYKSKKNQS